MTGQSKGLLPSVFTYQSLVHAIAGACGGTVAMSTFYPLDTARYRLQVENPEQRQAISTLQLLQQLVRDEGFATLYRGLVPTLQSLWISNFVYFYAFHTLKAICTPTNAAANPSSGIGSALRDLAIGSVAGIINVLATTPFWVVNTRLKMKGLASAGHSDARHNQSTDKALGYATLIDGLAYVWRNEGVAGLWAGTAPSLMLVSNPALQFMMYELLKRQLLSGMNSSPAMVIFAIGAMAKAFATVATYPLQLIQTKLRAAGKMPASADSGKNERSSVVQMCVYIIRHHGFIGLFRGLEAKLLQTVLTAALMFAAYEKIAGVVMSLLLMNRTRVSVGKKM